MSASDSLKVISFSLWGDKEIYTKGALRNAEIAKSLYRGWMCWFYIGTSTPQQIIDTLRSHSNCKVILVNEEGDWKGMFWRFLPASDPSVDVMISRDCDSRLTVREKNAVDEWLASKKSFHIMRDHPNHSEAILGGMWGVKNPLLIDMENLIHAFSKQDSYQVDQDFLREVIYPKISNDCMVHDEFFVFDSCAKSFSFHRINNEFVGERFDEFDNFESNSRDDLKNVGSYFQNIKAAVKDIETCVPTGSSLILVDNNKFWTGDYISGSSRVLFLEKQGQYFGAPNNSTEAIEEIERQVKKGINFLVIAWPAFWWIDFYKEWYTYLTKNFTRVLHNERVIIFDLQQQPDQED
jgi:hypothetical protein